jgi:hypothetical protein
MKLSALIELSILRFLIKKFSLKAFIFTEKLKILLAEKRQKLLFFQRFS